jgi:hypothetical protein
MSNPFLSIERRLRLLIWMMGLVLLLLLAVCWQGLVILGRLPR